MEIRIVLRGALSGFIAGMCSALSSRASLRNRWSNRPSSTRASATMPLRPSPRPPVWRIDPDGPEYFSRTVQSTWGLATGIIAFSTAMGALVAVAYLVLHGRFNIRPRTLALLISGFGFRRRLPAAFLQVPGQPTLDRPHLHHRHPHSAVSDGGGLLPAFPGARGLAGGEG